MNVELNIYESMDKYFDSLKEKYKNSDNHWMEIAYDLKRQLRDALWQMDCHSLCLNKFLEETNQ